MNNNIQNKNIDFLKRRGFSYVLLILLYGVILFAGYKRELQTAQFIENMVAFLFLAVIAAIFLAVFAIVARLMSEEKHLVVWNSILSVLLVACLLYAMTAKNSLYDHLSKTERQGFVNLAIEHIEDSIVKEKIKVANVKTKEITEFDAGDIEVKIKYQLDSCYNDCKEYEFDAAYRIPDKQIESIHKNTFANQ
ncbi:hypothetical protein [Ureibacillus aquaedulcis]|uniref:Uncharacterized protein n=1 Tax=Ureibacillus aquaedulcis TaxID=3058421 RepID=A0ABT8GST2_9BACL|nr:hypothetical protein [Ureibacillus sp. BA0131]MDN4494473.1 hypothetical protein [Ureibacillus sp. BA0131]